MKFLSKGSLIKHTCSWRVNLSMTWWTLIRQVKIFLHILSALSFKLKRNFVLVLLKLILNFISGEPKLQLIRKVEPSPSTKNLFLRLSEWGNKVSSLPKIIAFIAVSFSKLHKPAHQMLFHSHYTHTFVITICCYISCCK